MRWYSLPFICCSITLAFGAIVYIVMGIDLFPGHDGTRWLVLTALTVACGVLWGITGE